jgi:hypothetical protein
LEALEYSLDGTGTFRYSDGQGNRPLEPEGEGIVGRVSGSKQSFLLRLGSMPFTNA